MNILNALEQSSRRRLFRFILLAVGAVLCALTLVTQKLDMLEWIALVPSAVALIDIARDGSVRKRGLYGYGFFFFMCFYAVNYHWFANLYPLDFVDGMTKPAAVAVVLAGCLGLSLLQAVSAGVMFVIFGLAARRESFSRRPYLCALFIAALWAILEWSQTIGWVGVPWARLAIGQTGLLLGAQSASLFGSCFVTFLIVFVNFLIAYALVSLTGKGLMALIGAGVVAANFAFGAFAYFKDTKDGDEVRISVVQGNISSQEKWDFSLLFKTLEVYEKYTAEAAEQGARIVVWPESALPYNLTEDLSLNLFVRQTAKKYNVTLLVGAFTTQGGEEYNSIITALPDGSLHETVYSKRHLVPFGEYVPMRSLFEVLIPPLTELSMLSYDLAESEDTDVIVIDGVSIGSLICFDSIYDELARASVADGAQILAVSTNDSWFSDSAALDMHNAQASLRAIENGRYTVRAANTGISSVIEPNGKTISSLGALEEGQLTESVRTQNGRTLYSYVGNLFVYLCVIFAVMCIFCEKISQKIHKALDNKK